MKEGKINLFSSDCKHFKKKKHSDLPDFVYITMLYWTELKFLNCTSFLWNKAYILEDR